MNCSSLAAITIPQGVSEIGSNAFYGCSSLTSIEIPEGVKCLYEQVFYGCTALESVKLPQNLFQIGKNCFYNCGALSDISLPSSIEIIAEGAFYNCENLASPTLPTSLRTLVKSAFQYCRNITTIVLPDGVASIPESCFYGCSSLESVTIPEGVTDIGAYAFYGCNLNALTLPSTITSIGGGAFINNYNLQSIICSATMPPMLGENAIGSSVKEIKVPISSIAAYKQANGWKNFSNYCSGEVVNNGITYRIDENGATITAAEATLTEANIPSVVEFEGNQYPVIKINDRVFSDNINLTSVKIDNGLVEICRLAFNGCQNLESVMLPESLTTLGSEAFSSCKSLRAVKIPSGVASIPESCFYGCSSLESVTIPEGVTAIGDYAFGSCSLSNALILPESLEKIGDCAFYHNGTLRSVNIPAKVKKIEERAFSLCGLTGLVIPEGVHTIGSDAFYKNSLENLTLPSTVTSIGGGAFGENNNLKSIICNAATPPTLGAGAFSININPVIKVPISSIAAYRKASGWKVFTNYYGGEMIADGITYRINEKEAMVAAVEPSLMEANIPSAVEFEGNQYPVIKINEKVFSGNTNLTVVTLPEGLVGIGVYAFYGCKNLESVTLPESLTTLGYNAFRSCKSLKAVKIPSGVTVIPRSCFSECSSLESIAIPEGVTDIGNEAFSGCNLNALTLPESLEAIESSAFSGNQSLKSVNIPAKVKTIGAWAFSYCGLTELVIPEGVQTIGGSAFYGNSLQNLTLPSTITSIGNEAFRGNLQSIICNAATPPMLGDNAFSSGIMPSIKVPLASIAAYRKVYGWKDFSNYYGGEEIIDGVAYRIDDKGAYVQAAIMTESEVSLAENVAFEGAQYPLYKIADNAFAGNGSITLVTVPATVETIGSNAFDGVTYPIIKIKATTPPVLASKLPMLSAIVPPASVKAYKAANYWKDMTIIGEGKNDIEVTTSATVDLTEAIMTQAKITPASVTSIKVHGPLTNDDIINALNTNMRSCYAIDLSDAEIEALPDGAFNGKIGLLEISLPAGLKAIGNNAFRGCFALRNEVTIPAGVQTIGSYAFSGCRNAKFNPALPETLTAIGDYAFQNCANLYAVTLPASLQTIGDHAFEASNVQEAVLPAGLKTIGAYAFRKCSNITRVTLPDGLTTLGEGAFQQCEALVTADLMNPMDITSIPRYAFDGCSGLRNVYLPFFIETVGDYAFRGCASLRQIQFVAPTKTIGAYAFSGCRSLKSLDLFKCENFTTIGSYAFSGCTSLKSLNLPKSLETIGEYAFSGCQAISVISSPSLVPPTIANESALNGIDKDVCVLTMPKSVYLDYFRAPYWGQFVEYTASVLVGVDGQGSVMYSNNYGTAPTPVKVAAFYATAGDGDGVEEDEGDGITAEAYDSANICAKDNSTLTFRIVPDEGNEIKSVTYAGEDVTAQVVDGLFTTPVINGDTNLDVSFVASTDYIAIPASVVSKGAEVVVPVELVNTTEVMGIECKVQIPEGFSVAKKADGSLKVEQTERKADQTLTAAVDGNVLTVKTSGTQAYTGNTGAVFTIAIAPDEATAPADYVLKVTDVKFVNATGVASRPDVKTTLTLRDYVLGDVDSDQLVAINDAVIVMNHIVGADTPAFNAKAADMDGNGSVEINDAVLIMNTVVGTESTKSIKKTSATEPNADELTAADIEICQGGTAMLSLGLANLDALTAAQFEITLPEGITAGKAEVGERASRHMIKTNMVGNVLKVAMLSAESADFEGSEGAILVLSLSADKTMPSGSYGISLRNVKMSDARGNLFILPDADSSVVVKDWSGVDSVAFDRLRVYGGNGEICIESPVDTMIQIVAVDGRAFAVEASAGKTAVAVSAGVYVVNGQKVIVK
uniref:leucine-rich repeat protein n=1 Tax=Candidatus Limisoma sp. TaxID=3076476 RepID=UPI003FEFCFF4